MANTKYQEVFDSFLNKVEDDDWYSSYQDELESYELDWTGMLHTAVAMFKFPRFNTNLNDIDKEFCCKLSNDEIEILAILMKQEWLDRIIHSWEQAKLLYDERDFSPANMLAQLIKAQEHNDKVARSLQKTYSRAIIDEEGYKKPFDYKIFGSAHNV